MAIQNNQTRAMADKTYYNPKTKQEMSFSTEDLKNDALGWLSPDWKEGSASSFAKSIADEGNDIVDGAGSYYDEQNKVKYDANDTLQGMDVDQATADYLNMLNSNESSDVISAKQNYESAVNARQSGTYTPDEKSQIDTQVEQARLEYETLVKKAEEQRRKELPKDVIRAGNVGGFLNTQLSGIAAIAPTDANTNESFVGAGGRLSAIRQDYDMAVQDAVDRQNRAMALAKAQAQEAIRTGRKENYDMAKDLLKEAKDAQQEALDKAKEKSEVIRNIQKDERDYNLDVAQFKASEGRLQRTQELNEAKFTQDVNEETKKTALDNITKMAESGIDLNQMTDEDITYLESQAGLIPGTFEAYYTKLYDTAKREGTLDDLKVQQAQASLARTWQLYSKDGNKNETTKQYDEDLRKFKLDLADPNSDVDWGQAWNSMASLYPELKELADPNQKEGADVEVNGQIIPNQPLLDILLEKEKYYTK